MTTALRSDIRLVPGGCRALRNNYCEHGSCIEIFLSVAAYENVSSAFDHEATEPPVRVIGADAADLVVVALSLPLGPDTVDGARLALGLKPET